MKLFAHRKVITYRDYGSFLERVEGLAWSTTGKAEDATGFEHGVFETILAEKRAEMLAVAPGEFEIAVGEPIERTCDMNPHGLI